MRGIQPRMRPPPPSVEPWGGSPEKFKGASHPAPPRHPALWARAAAALPSPQMPASAAPQIEGCIHQVKGSLSLRMHPLTSSSHDVMTVHQVKGLIKSKVASPLGSPWTAHCSPRLSSPADLAAPAAPRIIWRPHSQLPEAPCDPISEAKSTDTSAPSLPWAARCSPSLTSLAVIAAPAAPRDTLHPHSQPLEEPCDPVALDPSITALLFLRSLWIPCSLTLCQSGQSV